jgi:hypothetical protein
MVAATMSFKDAFEIGYLSRLSKEERKSVEGLEKMMGQTSEVWTFKKSTPDEVLEELKGFLNKTEASLFEKTLTLLANESLIENKERYVEHIEHVRSPNPTGVEGEEFMGTN